jgi:hypothetical protein
LTNSGAVNVTAGRTLTIDAGATLFHSGGAYSGGTGVNNPSTNGKLIIGNNATFDWNASGTVNAGLNVQVGDTNGPGAVTGTGTITVNGGFGGTNGTIGAPIVVANGGTFGLGGNGTMTVSSTVTVNSGGIFAVAANQDSDANVKFTGAITNAGVAVLTMAGGITGPRNATIDLSLGSFTNSAGGLLLVPAGTPGGVREVVTPNAGPILNSGSIMIQTDTVFTGTNSVAISNQSGGTFTIQNGVSADFLGSGGFDNQSGATMTIDGFLNMHGNALVNAGEIKGSGTISMDGGTFDTSAGRSSIAPGNSPGHLTIDGNAVFGAGSHTVIELAGTAAGQFDTFTVTGHFTRGGVLDVVHYDGFAPQAGDSFHIMSWGSASGMFDAATGLADPGHGVALDPVFSDSGLTLMARPITLQGGSSDTTLSGTSGDDVMVGGSGHTIFNGGDGNDLMIGGTGDSRFLAGNGNDHIIGGTGENTVDFSYAARPVHVDLAEGTATTGAGDHDTIIGVQNVVGSTFADAIAGDAHNNVITGGAGADTLTGGGGANTFVYNVPSEGGDSITDFVSGKDIISILDQAFGDQSSIVDGQNFSTIQDAFNGSAAGNNAAFNAGKAAFVFSAHDSALYYDANGAGAGYTLVAHVEPGATVTAGDIHLFHGATT